MLPWSPVSTALLSIIISTIITMPLPRLQGVFSLIVDVFKELEEPSAPHFKTCVAVLESVSQVRQGYPSWRPVLLMLHLCCCQLSQGTRRGARRGRKWSARCARIW